jgi:hypothetical protein
MSIEADCLTRDGGRCVRCARGVIVSPRSCHHRQLKSQGGPDGPANRATTCGSGTTGCHGWIHSHPRLARLAGWMVSAHSDPAKIPIWICYEGWHLLGEDMTVVYVGAAGDNPPEGALDDRAG